MDSPLEPLKWYGPANTLTSAFQSPKIVREKFPYCFKPLGLWQFVRTVPGN